jgi:hypothetical protein
MERTLTLPNELPCWELESRWSPESSKSNYRGQNSLNWSIPYIIGKLLELRCLKWACMTHLDIWNTSYGQKKSRESNWQFDSRPLKVKNRPNFLACKWCATNLWKALDKGYNFASNFISIRGLKRKLWAPKVVRVRSLRISGLPFRSTRTKKTIWMWPPWRGAKYTIKGKVVASPKFGPWWVLWVRVARGSS